MSSIPLPAPLPVLLVAAHRLLVDALHHMIETDEDCIVVGKATAMNEVVALLPTARPSFIIADLDSSHGLNIALAEELAKRAADIPIIALTCHIGVDHLYQLLPFQFQALLTKDIDGQEFIRVLKMLKDGGGAKNFVTLHYQQFTTEKGRFNVLN
jgi:DNA-binding NarL/FixJ family response regulator